MSTIKVNNITDRLGTGPVDFPEGINSLKAVGIGTDTAIVKLHVESTQEQVAALFSAGTASRNTAIAVVRPNSTEVHKGFRLVYNPDDGLRIQSCDENGDFQGGDAIGTAVTVDLSNGNFTAAGEVTAYSDINLKDNIETVTDSLSRILNLRGVTFTRTDQADEETKHMGIIAQEIEQHFPEVVHTNNNGIKSVNYGAIAGAFIEAFKEQQAQINELKAFVQKLTDK